MPEALWFLTGCVFALVVVFCVARDRIRNLWAADSPADPPPSIPESDGSAPERPAPRRYELADTRSLQQLSESVAGELSSLASGIEGQSQLLHESLAHPARATEHAEQLWEEVRRLRFLSEKLQSSAAIPPLEMQPTDIGQLLGTVLLEIEQYATATLQVSLSTAPSLPLAMANGDALRKAVLFLIESVFQLEPNASILLLQAQAQESDHDTLVVRIDIEADLEEGDAASPSAPAPDVLFGVLAAENLLASQSADITVDHSPGLNAVASITLEATPPEGVTENEPIEIQGPYGGRDQESAHRFGGVLVMEGNPTIRHMISRELHKTERNVIVCADGIAASSLFNATPERFELLVLETESRRLGGEQVALRAIAQKPELRILLLTPGPGTPVDPALAASPYLRTLHKPFGLMELRESLLAALDARRGASSTGAAVTADSGVE